jgi:redox-sensitive bicupin YhaK (pirin superfamily)
MSQSSVISVQPLGFPWQTIDPFLFCVHHNDSYPPGNSNLGPDASLAGRNIGQDFANKDGWNMYHGSTVPGFPAHPHRGFETVTIVRQGLIDHSDSLGATARFGEGDVQWLTAGKGIVHCEMFPLTRCDAPNPLNLFQIWVNLPARKKMVEPHFTMLWSQNLTHASYTDLGGRATQVVCITGKLGELAGSPPPPDSWAAEPDSDLTIATIKLQAGGRWTLAPAPKNSTRRMLYFYAGTELCLDGRPLTAFSAIELNATLPTELNNTGADCELLLLQAKPIAEPVVQYGPFVMNTQAEIVQAFNDYRKTEFGGWPWAKPDQVHPPQKDRFAVYPRTKASTN